MVNVEGGVGVAQVVEPNHGEPGAAGGTFERLGDRVWVDGFAVGRNEDAITLDAGDSPFDFV
jgi:hypothetical protein